MMKKYSNIALLIPILLSLFTEAIADPREHDSGIKQELQAEDHIPGLPDARSRQDSLDILIRRISHRDPQARRDAIRIIGTMGGEEAAHILVPMLSDNDPAVRDLVISSLINLGPDAIPALIEITTEGTWKTAGFAAEALRGIGTAAHPALIELLRNGSWISRTRATRILNTTGWNPETEEERILLSILNEEWERCLRADQSLFPAIREILAVSPAHIVISMTRESLKSGRAVPVDILIPLLEHPDSTAREAVVRALGISSDRRMVEPLRRMKSDEARSVRDAVAMVLNAEGWREPETSCRAFELLRAGKIRDCAMLGAAALPAIRIAAGAENPQLILAAYRALALLNDPECLPALIDIVSNDKENNLHEWAAAALGRIGDSSAEDHLIGLLSSENDRIRLAAINALGGIGSDHALERMGRLLGDSNGEVRWRAANVLDKHSCEPISLENKVRFYAILGRWRDIEHIGSSAAPHLMSFLAEGETRNAENAIVTLKQIADSSAVPGLFPFLDHTRYQIRCAAAEALGSLGGSGVKRALLPLLNDPERKVRKCAGSALQMLGWEPDSMVDRIDYRYAMEDWEGLSELGSGAVPKLMRAVRDESNSTRESDDRLAEVFIDLDDSVVDSLIRLVSNSDGRVEYRAVRALAGRGDRRSLDYFLRLSARHDHRIAETAVQGLGRIGDPKAIDRLIAILSDQRSSQTGVNAIESLGRIGGDKAVSFLINSLEDENMSKRYKRAIVEILPSMGGERIENALKTVVAGEDDDLTRITVTASGRHGIAGPLEAALHHRDGYIRTVAASLLDSLEWTPSSARMAAFHAAALNQWDNLTALGSNGRDAILIALNDESPAQVLGAIDAAGRTGIREAVPRLADLLERSRNHTLRGELCNRQFDILKSSIIALGSIDDPGTVDPLTASLDDRNRHVRLLAIDALAGKKPRVITKLLNALSDRDKEVAQKARDVLQTLGDDAVTPLNDMIAATDEETRISGITGMGLTRCKAGVESLLGLLGDENHRIRAASAASLGQIGDSRAQSSLEQARWDTSLEVRIAATRALWEIRRAMSAPRGTSSSGDTE